MPPYDPPNAFYTEVQIPVFVDIPRLIGRDGVHLKNITHFSGCQYIWVDNNRRVVEIWGKESKLAAGIKAVRRRIYNLTKFWIPSEYFNLKDADLKTRIEVKSWEVSHRTFYEVVGSEQDIRTFFDELLNTYPFNPYMTQIEKRKPGNIIIVRFSSCD
jgi:hypothetical protein